MRSLRAAEVAPTAANPEEVLQAHEVDAYAGKLRQVVGGDVENDTKIHAESLRRLTTFGCLSPEHQAIVKAMHHGDGPIKPAEIPYLLARHKSMVDVVTVYNNPAYIQMIGDYLKENPLYAGARGGGHSLEQGQNQSISDEDTDTEDDMESVTTETSDEHEFRSSWADAPPWDDDHQVARLYNDDEATAAHRNNVHEHDLLVYVLQVLPLLREEHRDIYWDLFAEYLALRVSSSLVFAAAADDESTRQAERDVNRSQAFIHAHLLQDMHDLMFHNLLMSDASGAPEEPPFASGDGGRLRAAHRAPTATRRAPSGAASTQRPRGFTSTASAGSRSTSKGSSRRGDLQQK
jgi:hypothetical protein